jgi:RNA-directed DNA polymerase
MRTTGWCTAGASEKPKPSRLSFKARLAECHLELHPKTKIVYCKDGKRKGTYPNVKFDFLGYEFRPRAVWG